VVPKVVANSEAAIADLTPQPAPRPPAHSAKSLPVKIVPSAAKAGLIHPSMYGLKPVPFRKRVFPAVEVEFSY
jgi:hypothetical protein